MSLDERKHWAVKLKEAGNHAYGSKDFNKAIELYTKAILCKPEAVYYSNRAACYNALADWDKVVEDTTAAINLDPEYVKAMNRRANAYDKLEKYSESLLDYTASCIIDGFKNASSAEAVERLLKKFAESKAKEIMANKPSKLPSPTFVSNYLQSFRPKDRPEGLEDSAEYPADTGKGQLQLGLRAMESKTGEGYEEAAAAFDKAIELNDLGPFEAFAYNMRGTFICLRGKHEQALADLTKSVELDPSMTQSYIKRASMSLELGKDDLSSLFFFAVEPECVADNGLQASLRRQRRTLSWPWLRTPTTLTSTTTAHSCILSRASLRKQPRTTRSRSTWTLSSSSPTYNLV